MKIFISIFILIASLFTPALFTGEAEARNAEKNLSGNTLLLLGQEYTAPRTKPEFRRGLSLPESDDGIEISVNGNEETAKSDALRYNLTNIPVPETESWYLNNKILLSGKKSMLEFLVPENYLTADLPSRDKSPVSRFSKGADMKTTQEADISIKASNALLDILFDSLTRNMLIFNIIPGVENAISVQLHPVRNLIVKFNASGEQAADMSSLEITFLPTDKTNISLKTSEKDDNRKTGIEFQMMF